MGNSKDNDSYKKYSRKHFVQKSTSASFPFWLRKWPTNKALLYPSLNHISKSTCSCSTKLTSIKMSNRYLKTKASFQKLKDSVEELNTFLFNYARQISGTTLQSNKYLLTYCTVFMKDFRSNANNIITSINVLCLNDILSR